MVSAVVRAEKQTMVHTAEREQRVSIAMIEEWLSFSLLSLSAIFLSVSAHVIAKFASRRLEYVLSSMRPG